MIGLFPPDIRAGFDRLLDSPQTDSGANDLTISSIVHHNLQAKAGQPNGNLHFIHYADLSRDLRGQIAQLANILNIPVSPQTLDDLAAGTTFANIRRAVEVSETRIHESSAFHDQASFFASGTSNKREGRLTPEDTGRYSDICASILSPEDAAWLNWGDQHRP